MKTCNPQLEEGYVRIANELYDAIVAYPFTAAELKVLLYVMRRTYGWNRKSASITAKSISNATGLDMRYVKKVVRKLIIDKVILKEKKPKSNILGINKSYPQWRLWIILERVSSKTPKGVLQDTQMSVLQDTHKRQERQIFKDRKENIFNRTFREYLRKPIHIKSILSKWKI